MLYIDGQTQTWHPLCFGYNYNVQIYTGRSNGKEIFFSFLVIYECLSSFTIE
jgi:hypothetical protein